MKKAVRKSRIDSYDLKIPHIPSGEQLAWPLHTKHVCPMDISSLSRLAVGPLAADLARCLQYLRAESFYESLTQQRKAKKISSTVSEPDLTALLAAGIIEPCSSVSRYGRLFSVAEIAKSRRRSIYWPRQLNEEVEAIGFPVPALPDPVVAGADIPAPCSAACFDLTAGFYQIGLDESVRRFFGIYIRGKHYRLCRVPMGANFAPAIMHTVTSILADIPAADCQVVRTVFIDNVRFCGTADAVARASITFRDRCALAKATLNDEPANDAHQSGIFLGLACDYREGTVGVTESAKAKLRERLATVFSAEPSIADALRLFGSVIHASRILRIPLGEYYLPIKYLRRRCASVALGTPLSAPAEVWPCAREAIESWVEAIISHEPVRHIPSPAAPRAQLVIASDASLSGWGAVALSPEGNVFQAGGQWKATFESADINTLEMRALSLALGAFKDVIDAQHPSTPFLLLVDNSSVAHVLRKGMAREFSLNDALREVLRSLQGDRHVAVGLISSESNPADAISRGAQPAEDSELGSALGALGRRVRRAGFLRVACPASAATR